MPLPPWKGCERNANRCDAFSLGSGWPATCRPSALAAVGRNRQTVQAIGVLALRNGRSSHAHHEGGNPKGGEALFNTCHLLIAPSIDEVWVGTISALFERFASWKTTAPAREDEAVAGLGVAALSDQQRLVAGPLTPANLLDIARHVTPLIQTGGQSIKLVCRYPQFRGVSNAMARLLIGKTRLQDGTHDRRGGAIWHAQGWGKSLTGVFLVRMLRCHPLLRRFKVVLVTDRKDLQASSRPPPH